MLDGGDQPHRARETRTKNPNAVRASNKTSGGRSGPVRSTLLSDGLRARR
jgi:hypothetical protein